jgi:hypothetical protein
MSRHVIIRPISHTIKGSNLSPNKEHAMYDMKNLTKLKTLGELAPEAFKAFMAASRNLMRPR